MITLTITIEELKERKLNLRIDGHGIATEMETEIALEVRDAINDLMEDIGKHLNTESYKSNLNEPQITPSVSLETTERVIDDTIKRP